MHTNIIKRLLQFSQRHSVVIIISAVVITIIAALLALQIEIDADALNLIPEDEEYEELKERYGSRAADDFILIAAERPDAFDGEALKALKTMIDSIEDMEGFINSSHPFNILTFQKSGRKLEITETAPNQEVPDSEKARIRMKELLLSDPFARGLVISDDAKMLISTFFFEKEDTPIAFMEEIKKLATPAAAFYDIYYDGTFPFTVTTFAYLTGDFPKLVALAAAFILIIYFLSFRSLRSVLLPFAVVIMGTIWCIGIMTLFGYKLTLISIITPPLVLTIGSSYSIHLLSQYYRESHPERKGGEGHSWIAGSVVHVNKTIVMAAVTTIIGFLSLLSCTIEEARQFGIATSFGIFFCALLSLFFLPACLNHVKTPTVAQKQRITEGRLSRIISKTGIILLRFRFLILTAFAALVAAAFIAFPHIGYQTDFIRYFPEDETIIQDNAYIKSKIGKYDFINITLSAPEGEENYFLRPEVLEKILSVEINAEKSEEVAYIYSFVSYLAHLNEIMNDSYEIPQTRGLILLLSRYVKAISEMSVTEDTLSNFANEEFSELTISYRYREKSMLFQEDIAASIETFRVLIEEHLPDEIEVQFWGIGPRFIRLAEIFNEDQRQSTILAMLLVFIVTTFALRSFFNGIAALIPIITGITLNYIIMALLNIPLDMTTVMVSSVAIGVGIDDAIHFLLQYKRQLRRHPDNVPLVIANSLKITGRPILLTSLSIVGGLLVLTVAQFKPIVYFGFLVALALVATALGTLLILPAALSVRESLRIRLRRRRKEG